MLDMQANGVHKASERPFPWVCPNCRQKEVHLESVPYQTERLYEGRMVAVTLSRLVVPRCANCGELVFNYAADEQILEAVKAQAALLSLT